MVDLKPAPESDRVTTVRRGLDTKKLLLLVLVSILVHALGLFLFARYKPVEPTVSEKDSLDPIDFAVVPEESAETAVEDEAKNTPPPEPKPQPAPPSEPEPKITPPPTPPATPPATPPEPQVVKPEPKPTPPPEPESTEPPESSQTPALSGSDEAISEPEPSDSVATNQPPESEPIPQPEPATPDGVSNSASDLLGGDYEKTLASGGDDFFSPESLAFNAVLNSDQRNALKSIDLDEYFNKLKQKLKSNWNPDLSTIRSTFLNVEITKDGQLALVEIARTSGSESYDLEALETFRESAPFEPLPPDFPLESLAFEFEFYIINSTTN